MKRILLCIGLCSAVAAACSGDEKAPQSMAGVELSVEGWTLGTPAVIGGSNGSAEEVLFGVAGAKEAGGVVYVLNAGDQRLAVFDTLGSYLSDVGAKGTGPGQYTSPMGITVCENGHVFVLDGGTLSVLEYDADRRFTRKIPIDMTYGMAFAVMAAPHDKLYVEYRPLPGIGSDSVNGAIALLDPASGAVEPIVRFRAVQPLAIQVTTTNARAVKFVEPPFTPRWNWAPAPDGGLVYGDGTAYEVRHRSAASSEARLVSDPDHRALPVTKQDRDAFMSETVQGQTDDLQFPATHPHFDAIMRGPGRTLWIRVQPGSLGEMWNVHAPDGAQIGTLRLEPRSRIADVSERALYIVKYDVDDVETLLRIPIDTGGAGN